jgi:hypothetical protein
MWNNPWGFTLRKTLTAILLSMLTLAGSVAPASMLLPASAVQVVHA